MLTQKLIYGDCLQVMPDLEPHSIDFIFADLPYGTTKASWDKLLPLPELWENYTRLIKPNGAIVLFAQTPFDKVLGASNLEMLRYEWIWEKTAATGHLNAKKMPMKAHENLLVFYNGLPVYNPQKTYGHPRKVSTATHKRDSKNTELLGHHDKTSYDSTSRYPRSVLKFSSDKQKSKLHSTQKPIALCEYMINTYTNPGDIVLDNCCGSGSIPKAAKNLKRGYIAIDKDIKSYNISKNRLDHEPN